jgi:glycosyltransferase involved in cell wall biosynthesis
MSDECSGWSEPPLVSVIVKCYNRADYAREAITSVLGQTYRNLEILVQDDSTTDEVEEMVAALGDPRIVYARNRPPLKMGSNGIAGCRKARGKYFSSVDDDDRYAPEYLATMVEALERHPECVLGFCDHTIMDGNGKVDERETAINTRRWGRDRLREGVVERPLEAALVRQSVSGQFAVFRRSMIDLEDYPPEVSNFYDYWLVYLALRDGRPAYYSPRRMTDYRVHAQSQTSAYADPNEMLRSCVFDRYIRERLLADPRLAAIHRQIVPRLAFIHASEGIARLRLGQRGLAARALVRSLRISVNRRALAGLVLCAMPGAAVRRLIGR